MKSERFNNFKAFDRGAFRRSARYLFLALSLLTFHFSLFTAASAQDEPPEAAPPPLKLMSKEEIARLGTKQNNIKDRTKLSLELMNLRIVAAEKFNTVRDFENMYRELGIFHALMDDALNYLNKRDAGRGKVLDNFKRLEIGLRRIAPRIAVIRRELPLKYDPYVRKLMASLRSARAEATDSLFDDTVIPQKKPRP